MHLIDKFLVTGADSIAPRPCTPHASKEIAIEAAKGMISNADFKQSGAIIWVPFLVVKPKEIPIEVLNVSEVLAAQEWALREAGQIDPAAPPRALGPQELQAREMFRRAAAQYNKTASPKEDVARALEEIATPPPPEL